MLIEFFCFGVWDFVVDDIFIELFEEGNSVEKLLSDGLLWEEGLVGG